MMSVHLMVFVQKIPLSFTAIIKCEQENRVIYKMFMNKLVFDNFYFIQKMQYIK